MQQSADNVNSAGIRDFQKINLQDFQTQQELPSSTQNKIIANKKRKGGGHSGQEDDLLNQNNDGYLKLDQQMHSAHDEYLFNQGNFASASNRSQNLQQLNDMVDYGNTDQVNLPPQNMRSRQTNQDNTSNNTSSSIMKHAKSLYQFIVPVAQLNLNVNSNVTNNNNTGNGT